MATIHVDNHGNLIAQEGVDRCACGCKYWERDRCVSCGANVVPLPEDTDPAIAQAAQDNRIAGRIWLNSVVSSAMIDLGLATYTTSTDLPTRKLRNKR